jgi:hypothetical protein
MLQQLDKDCIINGLNCNNLKLEDSQTFSLILNEIQTLVGVY